MFSSVKNVRPTVRHLTPRRVAVGARANPSWFRVRARSHSGRVASLSHGHKDILSVASWPSVQAFGLRQNLQTRPPPPVSGSGNRTHNLPGVCPIFPRTHFRAVDFFFIWCMLTFDPSRGGRRISGSSRDECSTRSGVASRRVNWLMAFGE